MLRKIVQLARCYSGMNGKLQTLESKIEELSSREADINDELKVAELQQPGKKRKNEVENWLRNVRSKRNEVQGIKQDAGENNILSCLSLADHIDKLIGEIGELRAQGTFPGGLLLDMPESRGEHLLTTNLIGQAFEQNLNKIWARIMDDKVLCIGIYGMGGVGKTALALHIHNRLLERSEAFDHVYWFTVSQENSVGKLQKGIAKTMKLDFSNEDDEKKRAAELSQALTRRKKCILILDDIWNQIPLDRVGIPHKLNGCKLILTTRSLDLCQRMGCQAKFRVDPLLKVEAWNLFLETLGQQTTLSPEVIDIAKSVAAECAGLPLGIITMAASMRGVDDVSEWRSVLEELKELTMGHGDMENDVFPILKLSYTRLNDTKLQLCFLCCALFPEDYPINRDALIRYFVAEGLIDKRKSWQAKIDKGHTMLKKLERSCLLETPSHGRSYVKMPDLIRDMALKITETSHPRFMVKAGVGLVEIPDDEDWAEDLDKVSLMKNEIIEIPQGWSPKCPRLSTLILSCNRLERIADSFFVHMHALQLLDLSNNHKIVKLPNSISDLENLTALLLGQCKSLNYIPPLGKLRVLQELDLSDTAIKEVPQGVDELHSLKILNMKWTPNLEMIPSGTLSKLSHLQHVRLHCKSGIVQVQAKELQGLRELEEFEVRLADAHGFNRIVKSLQRSGLQLSKYSLELRHRKYQRSFSPMGDDEYIGSKAVRLGGCIIKRGSERENSILLPYDIRLLDIDKCRFATNSCLCDVFPFLCWSNTKDLKFCRIQRSRGIECIQETEEVDGHQKKSCPVPLQSLERLILNYMLDLNVLFRFGMGMTLPLGTFSMLMELRIQNCRKIKKLFGNIDDDKNDMELDPDLTTSLSHGSFAQQEKLINHPPVTLPKLKKLILHRLFRLESIYDGMLICDAIEHIHVVKCSKLKRLPFSLPFVNGQLSAPKALKKININYCREWWESLKWDHPSAKDVLQPFV